jgi:phosphatidylinositol alpha-mannosyltransferase
MKIGLVLDDSLDRPDGVQQYVLTLGEWLSAQGHEVHYLVGATVRKDIANIHSLSRNWNVKFNGNHLSTPLPSSRRAIRNLLQTELFDVLHIQMPYSPLMAHKVILNAPQGTAVVGTFHILPYSQLVRTATRLLGWWLRRSLRRFDKVFAVSPAAQLFAEQAFGLHEVAVMPNVAKLDSFAKAEPFPGLASSGNDSDGAVVMFLGRLVARKGCDTFLEAVAQLRSRNGRPFKAVVCGKGPLLAELQDLAVRLGIDDIVSFTGFVSEEDKPRYLSAATVTAFPSTGGESFGIVLIEAMAAASPVVLAASNPGYASVMDPRPELLFQPGNASELADKMAKYIESRTERERIVDWQRNYVQQFDVAAVGQRLIAVYDAEIQKKLQKQQKS